jgi:hypothetical protein
MFAPSPPLNTVNIRLTVNRDDHTELRRVAEAAGLSMAELLRRQVRELVAGRRPDPAPVPAANCG